jgi:2,4-dienoyl-CoA reductase-like NADH-dependent reductase (Old Yellow Enzyme family)
MNYEALFQPFHLKSLHMKNRFVMAPMTRSFSPGGVPTEEVANYYKRRAQSDVGLILSEGTVINRPSSSNDPNIPHFYGEKSLAAWRRVIEGVKAAGGSMAPQIWHMGVHANHASGWVPSKPFEGPSDRYAEGKVNGVAMTERDIHESIQAYADAAADAKRLGFDAVEIHGAHGYLMDQFFWDVTNTRTDNYGGKTIAERSRFGVETVKAVRKAVGEDFAILLRLSQWKPADYDFKLTRSPEEMESWLAPLSEAGVDIFHCSQRRFWEPEFDGSDLNFAGWAKKLTGKATVTVGSIGLSGEFLKAFRGDGSTPEPLDQLVRLFERGDFDLVGVGRALLSDAEWVRKIREGRTAELRGFSREDLGRLS